MIMMTPPFETREGRLQFRSRIEAHTRREGPLRGAM
ncbi:unnamed protein product, partial [Ascophyllum nodosum]